MDFDRVVLLIGPALVVEIVQQRGQSPEFLIGSGFPGISAHTGLNGQGMFAQAFVLGEFAEQGPSLISGWRHAGYSILSRRRMHGHAQSPDNSELGNDGAGCRWCL